MRIIVMPLVTPSDRWIAAALDQIDASSDEAFLRAGIDRALTAVADALYVQRPALELASAWSEALRRSVAAGVRLAGPADWTWFVSGSVARGEAAPGSDVETMVALGDAVSDDDKGGLLSRAARVHGLLERCRVFGDANGVLASRPRFCRREANWAEGIERWARVPHEDRGVVMTGLTADSHALPGPASRAGDVLRSRVAAAAGRNYPVRQALLHDATAVRASIPSRLRLLARSADSVDVKVATVDPVVKIARWGALSAGSTALSTQVRIDDAAAAGMVDAEDASSLQDCFGWLVQFRWRMRATAFLGGRPVDDVHSLSEMAPHDRATLRSVAREVTGISRKLTYLASTSAFH